MIDIIFEEADNSIESAYKEGYKQATVELQPEITYWKSLYDYKKADVFSNSMKASIISAGAGFILGSFIGWTIGIKIPIN